MLAPYKQEPPFCMQIEFTEGCNLRCNFCGLQGIREEDKHDYRFLTVSNAVLLADRILAAMRDYGWNPRLEFAMHGEPTMNPSRVELVRQFRTYLPKTNLMMISNGGGLLAGDVTANIDQLFDAGLNTLALDAYEYVNIVPKILERYRGRLTPRFYPADVDANPHKRRANDEMFVIIKDISVSTEGNHATLNNHAGAAFPKNDNGRGLVCAKPFRELSIRWDLNVAMCCNDWRGVHRIGNVVDFPSLEDLWQSDQFQASRRKLYRGDRDFGACKGCDAKSYRTGLLPDKKGEDWLEAADAEDNVILARGSSGPPLATPVLRPYELTVEGVQL